MIEGIDQVGRKDGHEEDEHAQFFSNAFLKTFVDQLVHDEGFSRDFSDWLLSIIRPLGLVCTIFCYIAFPMFIGVHSPRVNVKIGVEFLHGHSQPSRLQ